MKTRRLIFFILVPLFLLSLGWWTHGYLRFWTAVDTIVQAPPDKIIPSLRVARHDIRKVLEAGTRHSDRNARIKSAWALGELGDVRAVPALVAALSDRSLHVQESALKALKTLGKSAIPNLLRAIERQSVVLNHDRLADLFSEIGDSSQTPFLVNILRRGGPYARECAARVLSVIGSRDAVKPLIDAVTGDAPDVARYAAEALGTVGDRRAVAVLIDALRSEDIRMRHSAVAALGRIRDSAAVFPIVELLGRDTSTALAEVCIVALDSIADSRAAGALVDLAHDPSRTRLRPQIVSALRSIASGAVDTIVSMLSGDSSSRRMLLLEVVTGVQDTSFVEVVIAAVGDDDPQIRRYALEGLSRLVESRVVGVFRGFLQDSDADIRRYAVRALGRNRDRESIARISAILLDTRLSGVTGNALRQDAAAALGTIGDQSAGAVLIRVLSDRDNPPALRCACADALGTLKHTPGVRALIDCLAEKPGRQIVQDVVQWDVRLSAIRALGEIRASDGMGHLLDLTESEDRKLRIAAISALGGFTHERAVGRLEDLGKNQDSEVAAAAQAALTRSQALVQAQDVLPGKNVKSP